MTEPIDHDTAVDLSTTYLGLQLRTPLVASPGPLTGRLEPLQALEDNGISAVVLPSLFEEQVAHDELEAHNLFELGADANPEATSYFPDLQGYASVGERYLQHVRDAKKLLSVPVIGSLNGATPGGWVTYARKIAEAGADALELNLYEVAADLDATADQIESAQLELVAQVKATLEIPLAVKVGPYYTAFAAMARSLVDAGADGLVLFNRFYQPDPDTLQVRPWLELSRRSEIRLPLRWTAILSGRLDASLAMTGGVHRAADVARGLLAGADVTMMTSILIDQGPLHIGLVEEELVTWIREMGYTSVDQLRGSVSHRTVADPSAFERANYIDTLVHYTNTFHAGWGFGPTDRTSGCRATRPSPPYPAHQVLVTVSASVIPVKMGSSPRCVRDDDAPANPTVRVSGERQQHAGVGGRAARSDRRTAPSAGRALGTRTGA